MEHLQNVADLSSFHSGSKWMGLVIKTEQAMKNGERTLAI